MQAMEELRTRQEHKEALAVNDTHLVLAAEIYSPRIHRAYPRSTMHPDLPDPCFPTVFNDLFCHSRRSQQQGCINRWSDVLDMMKAALPFQLREVGIYWNDGVTALS